MTENSLDEEGQEKACKTQRNERKNVNHHRWTPLAFFSSLLAMH